MSKETNIGWCDSTANFWIGCTKVSDGCKHCYAEAMDTQRYSKTLDGGTKANPISHWGQGAPRHKSVGAVKQCLAWNKKPWICNDCGQPRGQIIGDEHLFPGDHRRECNTCGKITMFHRRRVFSLSFGDWLDDEVPIEWLAEMWDTIRRCDQLTFILCTKRPENWRRRMGEAQALMPAGSDVSVMICRWVGSKALGLEPTAPPNVWLLTSVEHQAAADERIPKLLEIPAVVRGLSLEPLLSAVELGRWIGTHRCINCQWRGFSDADECPSCGASSEYEFGNLQYESGLSEEQKRPPLNWLIIGLESGRKRRDAGIAALLDLAQQGQRAGVPVFAKQDCAFKSGEQGRIPDEIWKLKQFPEPDSTPRR